MRLEAAALALLGSATACRSGCSPPPGAEPRGEQAATASPTPALQPSAPTQAEACDGGGLDCAAPGALQVPYTTANPILYSNDHPEDVHTDVIVMAMQSHGAIDLRGIITDQQRVAPADCSGDGCHTIAIDDDLRRAWIAAARKSGFRNLPDSVTGAAAVALVIAEARAATAELPLVIIVGGPLTLVAEAYRQDPSIAASTIVSLAAFSFNEHTHGKYRPETNITVDAEAAATVFEHMRVVVVPFADFNEKGRDQTRYPATPLARVATLPNSPLRERMQSIYGYPWAHYDADGGPIATLLSTHYVTGVMRVRWQRDDGGPYLDEDSSSDDLLITSVDGSAVTEPWWRHVTQAFAGR